jgi:CheY-like chemotaxis protein
MSSPGYVSVPEELLDHPRYEIIEFLGAGGMGVVYKARHRMMQREVALKIIHPGLLRRREMIERFRREVRTAARLAHPNIVHAYDAEQWRGIHYLVMECIDGLDLERLLTREDRLPAEPACGYARQVAIGLQHAHERGMIHRDIKPHNLILSSERVIKILDFGLARFVEEAIPECLAEEPLPASAWIDAFQTCGDTRLGTVDYLAPEAIVDPHAADIRSDIYSLGCTLYRLVSGRLPCPSEDVQEKIRCHQTGQLRPLSEVCGDVPGGLLSIVQRMLAADPADRFQVPCEVADALAAFEIRKPRVLVVDDEPAMQQITSRVLSDQGYTVHCAANGRDALRQLRAGLQPDLILLDLMMPEMDGWQFLREQKQDEQLASIPVIVVSSNDAVALRAAAAGAVDCLKKPLHYRTLTATLEALKA